MGDGSLRIVADLLDADYRTKLTDEGLIDHTNYSPSYDDFVVADILADFIKKLDQEPNLDVKEALRTYFSKEPNYYLDEGWKGGWACGYRDNAYELDITEIFLSAMEEAVRARDSDPEHFADLYFGPRFSRTKEYEELSKQIDVWEDELWHIELFRD